MIEVEQRALLKEQDFARVCEFLDRHALKQAEFKRFTLVSVPNPDFVQIPDNDIDIKIRTTTTQAVLTLKKGSWHSDAIRQEHEVRFEVEQIAELLNILFALGRKYFVATYVYRKNYQYREYAITLDNYLSMGASVLEIEREADSKESARTAEQEVRALFMSLQIAPLDSKATQAFIAEMNSITEYQINFDDLDIKQWCIDWKPFLLCTK